MDCKFSPGIIYTTAGVNELRNQNEEFNSFVFTSLTRHLSCDWGDIDPEDEQLNLESLSPTNPGRLFSSYHFPQHTNLNDWKIWIITEWDRSATTILFPHEY